jgi:hypothetical protein
MYNLLFTCYQMYIQYIQGLCQSRLSTADHVLFLVAHATTAVYSIEGTDSYSSYIFGSPPGPHRKHRSSVACVTFVTLVSSLLCRNLVTVFSSYFTNPAFSGYIRVYYIYIVVILIMY